MNYICIYYIYVCVCVCVCIFVQTDRTSRPQMYKDEDTAILLVHAEWSISNMLLTNYGVRYIFFTCRFCISLNCTYDAHYDIRHSNYLGK
jgi:hypothetical protein